MQVVFDSYGCEQVYFVAPSADRLPAEVDVVIKAGIAHLWFITIHPFDNGNGRLTHAIIESAGAKR